MAKKLRLDNLMVERGLAESRSKAQALIMGGQVVVGDHAVTKAGAQVACDASVRLKGDLNPYVSRGGLKLEGALKGFAYDPSGLTCVDVGASTGGFTDCLLKHGAAKVYAVDVGYGQLAWQLREDPRVINIERQNVRHLTWETLGELVDLAVIDASFISLELVLPHVVGLLKQSGDIIALVKPQFEVDKGEVGKGGVVRDPILRKKALEKVRESARLSGLDVIGEMESPIKGAKKGNVEFLLYLKRN
ncbi:MAG: TlyA family rRNA (cytidine-2'-O)-methyltransferase [Deltaproteobacteria bacterium]|nr:MAG: TlyA family rRNA (cytidine-2'-O)-methyltransferase [Deltaproteobacteria bacterium]